MRSKSFNADKHIKKINPNNVAISTLNKSVRQMKVAEEIKRFLSHAIFYDRVLDNIMPADFHISLSHVDISPDLRHAKVFITCFITNKQEKSSDKESIAKCLDILNFNANFFNHYIASKSTTKVSPEVKFYQDEKPAELKKLELAFDKIGEEPYSEEEPSSDDSGGE